MDVLRPTVTTVSVLLRYILKRSDNDLLKMFFQAQVMFPAKNDWCTTVMQDLQDFEINYTVDEISSFSKKKWAKIVRLAYKAKAFDDLLSKSEEFSKGENLLYGNLDMRKYLKSNSLSLNQKKIIFKFRTRMINVKDNFRNSYKNLNCRFNCFNEIENQEHLLVCSKLPNQISKSEYRSIYGNNPNISEIAKKLEQNLKKRDMLIEN